MKIRLATEQDLPSLLEIVNKQRETPRNIEDLLLSKPFFVYLVLDQEEKLLGWVSLWNIRGDQGELGVFFVRASPLLLKAVEKVLEKAFFEHGLEVVEVKIPLDNQRALRAILLRDRKGRSFRPMFLEGSRLLFEITKSSFRGEG